MDIKDILGSRKIPTWNELPDIDLYMDQIIVLMEKYLGTTKDEKLITSSMINNYVKLGIVPPPVKKKYSRIHIAYLIIICSLKQVMPISDIKILIDEKLKNSSIDNLLDEYRKLYEACVNQTIELASSMKSKDIVDNALFLATISNISRFTSEKLLQDIK